MANDLNKSLLVSAARELGDVIKLNAKMNGAIYRTILAASLVGAEYAGLSMKGQTWKPDSGKSVGNDVWKQVFRAITAKAPTYDGSETIWDAHIPGSNKDNRAKNISEYIKACQKAKLKIIPTVAKAGTIFRKVFEDMIVNHADDVKTVAGMTEGQAETFGRFFANTFGANLAEVVAHFPSKPQAAKDKVAEFLKGFDSVADLQTLILSAQARIEFLEKAAEALNSSSVAQDDEEDDFEFSMAA